MTLRFNIKHQFFDLLRLVGLRDRLRCPSCKAIGTWKPHGGWLDKPSGKRRWLCKFCGYYIGPEGYLLAYPSDKTEAWEIGSSYMFRPQQVLNNFYWYQRHMDVWPWRG